MSEMRSQAAPVDSVRRRGHSAASSDIGSGRVGLGSVLASTEFSVNHDADDVDAADVTSVARELIDQAVNALDIVELTIGLRNRRSE